MKRKNVFKSILDRFARLPITKNNDVYLATKNPWATPFVEDMLPVKNSTGVVAVTVNREVYLYHLNPVGVVQQIKLFNSLSNEQKFNTIALMQALENTVSTTPLGETTSLVSSK